jgi:hypothetical protein
VGRYYHTSSSFNGRYIFIFCGVSTVSGQKINSIERYDSVSKKTWDLIEISPGLLSARQGLGAAQINNEDILIFGGFGVRFMKDVHIFSVKSLKIKASI